MSGRRPVLSAAAFSPCHPCSAAALGTFPCAALTASSHPADLGADSGAGQLRRGAPSRVFPSCLREPGLGQPLPPCPTHAPAQVRAPSCTAPAPGAPWSSRWPWHGRLALFLIGSSETKPREMNEAHSWLRNPCEGLKHEQLRGRKASPAPCGTAKISSWGQGVLAPAGKHQVLGGQAPRRLLTAHLSWLSLVPWQHCSG